MLDDVDDLLGPSPAALTSAPLGGLQPSLQGLPAEIREGHLAALLGVSAARVRQLHKDGVLIKVRQGTFAFEDSLRRYLARLRESAERAGRPTLGGDELKAERLRLTKAQADKEETRVARERGELVPVADTLREWQGILRDVRAAMLAVPSRFASTQPHLTPHDIAALTDEIKRSLEGLSDGND